MEVVAAVGVDESEEHPATDATITTKARRMRGWMQNILRDSKIGRMSPLGPR